MSDIFGYYLMWAVMWVLPLAALFIGIGLIMWCADGDGPGEAGLWGLGFAAVGAVFLIATWCSAGYAPGPPVASTRPAATAPAEAP